MWYEEEDTYLGVDRLLRSAQKPRCCECVAISVNLPFSSDALESHPMTDQPLPCMAISVVITAPL